MSGLPQNPTTAAANGSASTPSQAVSATASSPGAGAAGPATPAGYAHLPTNPMTTGAAATPGNGTLVQGVQPTGMASPMSMQSAMGFNAGMAHPGMMGGVMGGMDQPKRAHLYVGNLSGRVTEYMLTEIFAVAGPVANVKIIPDRNFQHGGLNYGFVEYNDMRSAEQALQTLNGRKIFDTEIRVNWAYQGQQGGAAAPREDTQGHFHVFVGDLSPEVNDEVLAKAFGAFGTLSEARVMWDMNSGKSRGYGFLAFREKADAEQAIATMNGEWLGSRAIRVNWANQKTQTGGGSRIGGAPAPTNFQGGPLDYETVLKQTPAYNTTVYVGNLIPYTSQSDLIPLFQGYGYIVEIRMQADRGFAFVKLDTHENAALAIVQLQNQLVHGRPVKCSWGKDREGGGPTTGTVSSGIISQQPGGAAMPGMMGGVAVPAGYPAMLQQQVYGMPQANAYAQYAGYPGYNAYAAQMGMGVGGAPGPGIPGQPPSSTDGSGANVNPVPMPPSAPGSLSSLTNAAGQWGATNSQDPNAAAAAAAFYQQQAAAPQWGTYYGGQAGGQ